MRLGAAQRGLAGRPPLRDEPRTTGRGHRNVLGRHDRLLLLRQEELAQQVIFNYATKPNCLRHNAFCTIKGPTIIIHAASSQEESTLIIIYLLIIIDQN